MKRKKKPQRMLQLVQKDVYNDDHFHIENVSSLNQGILFSYAPPSLTIQPIDHFLKPDPSLRLSPIKTKHQAFSPTHEMMKSSIFDRRTDIPLSVAVKREFMLN
jgi:hypothetical protein